jgi:glycogen operon protein
LAFTAETPGKKILFHAILNAYWETLEFEVPRPGAADGNSWRRWIDTSLDSPDDIVEWEVAPTVAGDTYRAGPRSVVVLFAGIEDGSR